MDLDEIKGRVDRLVAKAGKWPVEAHHGGLLIDLLGVYDELCEIRRLLDEPMEAALDPEGGVVCISLARFDELRQAEEDLQEVRVAIDESAEPLHPPPAISHMQDMQDMRGQVDVLAGRIAGLYALLKERADASRDFAAGVGARLKDQGERITRHHERFEETDRRLKSFGARLAEVEAAQDKTARLLKAVDVELTGRVVAAENEIAARRPNARDGDAKEKEAVRRKLEELNRDLRPSIPTGATP